MWTLFFSSEPVEDYDSARKSDTERFARFFWAMLERGVYIHPWHNMFLCAAMTDGDINDVLDASRLQGGLLTIEMRPENVMDVAEVAIKLARGVVADKRSVEIDVPVGMPSLLVG